MDKASEADKALIARLGVKNLAGMLGASIQTVSNWKRRGIPPRVKLDRPDLFLSDLPDRRSPRKSKSPEVKVA